MDKALEKNIRHFIATQKMALIEAGEALSKSSLEKFNKIADKLSKLRIVETISQMAKTLYKSVKDFLADLTLVLGVAVAAAGLGALLFSAGVATALGIAEGFVLLIAVVLLVAGVCMVFPKVGEYFKKIFNDLISSHLPKLSS